MKLKKILAFLMIFSLIMPVMLSSCTVEDSDKKKIVCTSFAQYDFTMNILGAKADDFDVTYLLSGGSDMHSYSNSISVSDKIKILSCDLFIYIGGESEKWIDEILSDDEGENVNSLALIESVGEKLYIGGHTDGDGHSHSGNEYDEHIWLSPKRAIMMCEAICTEVCGIDRENEELYRENCENYIKELEKLDDALESTVKNAQKRHLVFADRFPFAYLAHDYEIEYTAAFDGCSSETNATYETIVKLADALKKNDIKFLIILENSTVDIADTVVNTSGKENVSIESMFSMQSVSKKDIENGVTYLSAMYENIKVIGKATN